MHSSSFDLSLDKLEGLSPHKYATTFDIEQFIPDVIFGNETTSQPQQNDRARDQIWLCRTQPKDTIVASLISNCLVLHEQVVFALELMPSRLTGLFFWEHFPISLNCLSHFLSPFTVKSDNLQLQLCFACLHDVS